MSMQKYKDFLENQMYTEVEIKKENEKSRKLDNKTIAIIVLACFAGIILCSHMIAKYSFNRVYQYQQEEIEHLKEVAYDGHGRTWQERYEEVDRNYQRALEQMNALGYDMSFQYIGEGAE